MNNVILEVKNLTKHFEVGTGFFGSKKIVHAVEDVTFKLFESETLGIVGESGSGKSTLARLITGLINATSGQVIYKGKDITGYKKAVDNQIPKEIQMVFQDPYASLNPRIRIGDAIAEPIAVHKVISEKKEIRAEVERLLKLVGLQPEMYDRFPHEFSGGQRQRIVIARALALRPRILICDEAVSALDVSIQAQILNLFNQLKRKLNLTYIFIGHDLSVVRYISDRIMVMYLGEIVELAAADDIFNKKFHPYTQALISAIPEISPTFKSQRIILEGDIPSPIDPPKGCKFNTRCFKSKEICKNQHPVLKEVLPGHYVRCHFVE
ncbi:ABC transporter ATP-binding protein [Thermovenabulum gondwanense]|uniref:Oligopeptide transport ATP-binding protein OppF n=1 Tax=Thermovenabulum gondwanense TaxID=520767 RepID=A0A162MQH0_9FIRM|nr:dipeptide ABC transporter ATP-binding protein [Thermovenabulum gondwanense]KYO66946.1 Oligopeptide transport ATP-binding protein OppF [Thermovenabulum gondwanense]